MKAALIIPAGGEGKRLGADIPKQYIRLLGKEIIIRTLEPFTEIDCIETIIIAARRNWIDKLSELCHSYFPNKNIVIVEGGKERQDSVYNALQSKYIAESEIILVHDAVRPFVKKELILSIISAAEKYGAAIPGITPKNTIKLARGSFVAETIDRSTLREIHTPQAFKSEVLIPAYNSAKSENFSATDCSTLVEMTGNEIAIVDSTYENIKITTAFDIQIAEMLLKAEK